MKGGILLLLLVYYVTMTNTQRCSQSVRTICDDDTTFTWTRTLDKSDVACPEDGEMNEDEENDNQTACCNLGPLRTDIVTRLTKIEELLTSPSTTTMATTNVTTTTTSSITSCAAPSSNGPHNLTSGVEVYCEDGWTVFQRRIDGSVDFGRRWDDYANGFGQIDGEFWLGLDHIHEMTREGGCRLKIELWDFDGNQRHANYSSGNCATQYGGTQGWWFGACFYSALNGVWMRQSSGYARGIIWYHWKGYFEPLKETKMKLRCD